MIVRKIWEAFGVNGQVEFNCGVTIWCTERVLQPHQIQGCCFHPEIGKTMRPTND